MKRITLKDIAEKTNLSLSTVSRILSGQAKKYRIKDETEEYVIHSAKELGFTQYKSNYRHQHFRNNTIGLIIPDISHHFLGDLAHRIIQQVKKIGFNILLCDSLEDTDREIEAIQLLLTKEIDGIIINPVGKESKHLQKIYLQGIPLVVVDRILPNISCSSVGVDNFQGSLEAMDYLIERGHQKIACIQRLPDSWINNERIRAYRQALKKHQIPINESFILGDRFGEKNGYLEVKQLLNTKNIPTAIFSLSYLTTIGALRALQEENLQVPQDMSIVGFDDLPLSEYFTVSITTVKQPVSEMAKMAVKLLMDQIESPVRKEAVTIKLQPSLIQRYSVRMLKNEPTVV